MATPQRQDIRQLIMQRCSCRREEGRRVKWTANELVGITAATTTFTRVRGTGAAPPRESGREGTAAGVCTTRRSHRPLALRRLNTGGVLQRAETIGGSGVVCRYS
jgi:hypothetical protein